MHYAKGGRGVVSVAISEILRGSGKPWSQVTRQRHYTRGEDFRAGRLSIWKRRRDQSVCVLCGNTRYTTISILGLRVTEG